ncbi:hypothetical protein RUM43_002431 [Polyplax serrata]|uniref:Uncharacterized protein n=1 Tax=Polyplax serrata TaxID=468196 RepID=A0AAN8PFZ4_POLSC
MVNEPGAFSRASDLPRVHNKKKRGERVSPGRHTKGRKVQVGKSENVTDKKTFDYSNFEEYKIAVALRISMSSVG